MKVTFTEQEACFCIELQPETMQDAVQLARFGIAKTKELRSQSVYFNRDGTADAHIVIGKKKNLTYCDL